MIGHRLVPVRYLDMKAWHRPDAAVPTRVTPPEKGGDT